MLKIHSQGEKKVYPELQLTEDGSTTCLDAVTKTGVLIARLIIFRETGKVRKAIGAFNAIKSSGYNTDFAEWNEDGSMKVE